MCVCTCHKTLIGNRHCDGCEYGEYLEKDIKVKHIHNKQAVEVTTETYHRENWIKYIQNNMQFLYWNDRLNGMKMVQRSEEQQEASRGNY